MADEKIDPVDAVVGFRLRAARQEIKMSQGDLATAVGLSFQQIQKYEKGTNRVSMSMMKHLADVIGKRVGWFVGEEPNQVPMTTAEVEFMSLPGAAEFAVKAKNLTAAQRKALFDLAGEMNPTPWP